MDPGSWSILAGLIGEGVSRLINLQEKTEMNERSSLGYLISNIAITVGLKDVKSQTA